MNNDEFSSAAATMASIMGQCIPRASQGAQPQCLHLHVRVEDKDGPQPVMIEQFLVVTAESVPSGTRLLGYHYLPDMEPYEAIYLVTETVEEIWPAREPQDMAPIIEKMLPPFIELISKGKLLVTVQHVGEPVDE